MRYELEALLESYYSGQSEIRFVIQEIRKMILQSEKKLQEMDELNKQNTEEYFNEEAFQDFLWDLKSEVEG